MKKIFLLFFLFNVLFGFSQDEKDTIIKSLTTQIHTAEGAKKLMLLDSLSRVIGVNGREQNFDSITKATIDMAYELDSLDIVLSRTSDLIFYYGNRSSTPELGAEIFEDFKTRNLEEIDYEMLARLYTNAGDAYFFLGATEESVPIYSEAEKYALMDNDSSLYAVARTYKASYYVDTGDYATGSKHLKETTALFTKQQDTVNALMSRNTLANIYSKMGFYEEAKKERDEIIRLAGITKNYNSLIPNLYNASIDAKKEGDLALCISYLTKAYDEIKRMEQLPNSAPIIEYALLAAYSQSKDFARARQFFNLVQDEHAKSKAIPFEGEYRHCLAEYFIATKDFGKAIKEAQKRLEIYQHSKNTEGIYESFGQLSRIAQAQGDFEGAFDFSEKYNTFKDSVNSVQKARGLSYYQTLYEMEKRDFKIEDQAAEISLLDAKNRIKSQWILFGGLGLLALFVIVYLVRSRKFVLSKQAMQEQFSQDLIEEQERERTRLARELHDSVGQKLMLLSRQTKDIGNANMEDLADNTLEEIRSISRGLHPSNLERLGLTESINSLAYDINANTALFFTEEIDNIDNVLTKDSELHLYRIIQETLNNVVKHAEAKAVKMEVSKSDDYITVAVSDNGKGFDFEKKQNNPSLGLKTLFERAKIIGAQLNLNSKLNKGTEMNLTIPI